MRPTHVPPRQYRESSELGHDIRLHGHKVAAIEVARPKRPNLAAASTGSGQSFTYIAPVADHVLRNGSGSHVQAIIEKPPVVLLTNYVMLELILTWRHDRGVVAPTKDLRFLVFAELHTHRGRQGAEVSMQEAGSESSAIAGATPSLHMRIPEPTPGQAG